MSALTTIIKGDLTVSSKVFAPIAEINREHRLAHQSANEAIAHARRCGELLIEQRKDLARGEFDSWVAANCEFSRATAYNYIKLANSSNALDGSAIRHLFPSGRKKKAVAAQVRTVSATQAENSAAAILPPVENVPTTAITADAAIELVKNRVMKGEKAERAVSLVATIRTQRGLVTKLRNQLQLAERKLAAAESDLIDWAKPRSKA